MGLSTAFFLSHLGERDVTILESQPALGSGSTGRNPGAIRTGFSSPINIEMTLASKRIIEDFFALTGVHLNFNKSGYLWMASTKAQAEGLQSVVRTLQARGIPANWLTAEDTIRLVPALDKSRIIGASFEPEDGIVNPHEMLTGFAHGARRAGVEIRCDYPVAGLQKSGKAITGITSPKGDLEADVVIIAAGPYAGTLAATAGIEIPVQPFRRHSFLTGPCDWVKDPMPFVVDAETGAYFSWSADKVTFGRGREYKDDPPTFSIDVKPEALHNAHRTACQVIPAMAQTTVMHGYAGLYSMTPDLHAILGPVEAAGGMYMACGFSGHGLMHAPVTGLLLAEWIVYGEPRTIDARPLRPERFERSETVSEHFQI